MVICERERNHSSALESASPMSELGSHGTNFNLNGDQLEVEPQRLRQRKEFPQNKRLYSTKHYFGSSSFYQHSPNRTVTTSSASSSWDSNHARRI